MYKKIFFTVLICITGTFADSSATNKKWNLIWSDEFNTPGLPDSKKWYYDVGGDGWGNNELQYYTDGRTQNARIEDTALIIEMRKESFKSKNYTSARMVTKNKGDWLYGRVEVRAIIPQGKGTWPAIWMLPTEKKYGEWPKSGEIDIMEHVGYQPGIVHATVHTDSLNHTKGTQVGNQITVKECFANYHLYAIEWYDNHINAFVDDSLYFTFKNRNEGYRTWPFDKKFHLLLNIAMGGSWGGAEGIDESLTSAIMRIDYVRIYEVAAQDSVAPLIITQPQNISVSVGEKATFHVEASGYPLTYQWYKNGNIIPGANSSDLTIGNTALSDDKSVYTIIVRNNKGSETSTGAVLSVSGFNGAQFSHCPTDITIDGAEDEAWGNVTSYLLTHTINGTAVSTPDLSVTFRGMWDESGLYVLFTAIDDTIINGATETWQDDAVEMYIDGDNSKSASYDADDFQYRFVWGDSLLETKHNAIDGVKYSFRKTVNGYLLEVKLPWNTLSTTVKSEKIIGFDIHVNDADVKGTRDTKIAWTATSDNTYQTPSVMGNLLLISNTGVIQSVNRMVPQNFNHHQYDRSIYINGINRRFVYCNAADLSGRKIARDTKTSKYGCSGVLLMK
jgi:beta-glucanase (GH16 family)